MTVKQRENWTAALDQSRAQEQLALKTPTAAFGRQQMEKICRLCQVADESQLPPLWLELANTPKHSRVSVTGQAFDMMKNLLGHLPFTALATVPLVAKLISATFDTTDPDDLAQGIGPFQFGLVTPSAATQIAHQVQMYQLIQGGGRSTVPLDFDLERVVVLASNGMYHWVAILPYNLTPSPNVGPPRTVAPSPVYSPAATEVLPTPEQIREESKIQAMT